MVFLLLLQALDTFNTAVVSPIYYVMFTTLTIVASAIIFKVNISLLYMNGNLLMNMYCAFSHFTTIYELRPCIRWLSNSCTSWLQDWSGQNVSSIASELCGLVTVLSGTIILHSNREQEAAPAAGIQR